MIPCLLLLPAALLLDILFGDPPNRRHPVCLIGWCARRLEPEARRLWGGSFKAGMLAALGVCAAAECGLFLLFLPFFTLSSLTASPWLPWIPAVLAVYICMAPRGLAEHAARVASALRRENGEEGATRNGWTPAAWRGPPSKAWRKI